MKKIVLLNATMNQGLIVLFDGEGVWKREWWKLKKDYRKKNEESEMENMKENEMREDVVSGHKEHLAMGLPEYSTK